MKLKLVTLVVLALVVCATVPMAALAAGPTTTALNIHPPAAAVAGSSFDLTGTLSTGTARTGVGGSVVTVYKSIDGKKWTAVGSDVTGSDGSYTVTVPASQSTEGTYYYKATFAGDKFFKKVTSGTILVTVAPGPVAPTAAFTSDVTSGPWPLKVQFTDASTGTGPFTYAWDFGDGQTSTDKDPSHTFADPNTYTVTLTVTGPGGVSSEVKKDITVEKVKVTLTLTVSPTAVPVGTPTDITYTVTTSPTLRGATISLYIVVPPPNPDYKFTDLSASWPGMYTKVIQTGMGPGASSTVYVKLTGDETILAKYVADPSNMVTITAV